MCRLSPVDGKCRLQTEYCRSGLGAESQLLRRPDFELHERRLSAAPRNLTFIGGEADGAVRRPAVSRPVTAPAASELELPTRCGPPPSAKADLRTQRRLRTSSQTILEPRTV